MAGAGWYPDPLGRAQVRYFDGAEWSQWAADDGRSRLDADAVLTALPPPPDSPPPGMPTPPGAGLAPVQAGAYRPAARYRSIQGLSTALMWVLICVAVAAAGSALVRVARIDAINRFLDDGSVSSYRDYKDAHDAVGVVMSIVSVLNLTVFVLFVIYLFRAVTNTELWNVTKERWTPGWAIGGWFIPFANFVIPFLVVLETWRRSDPDVRGGAKARASTGLLWCWWLAFAIGFLLIQIDPNDDSTFDEVKNRDGLGIAGAALLVASAVLMIVLVRRLAAWQRRNAPSAV
jgi:hypothetical protein